MVWDKEVLVPSSPVPTSASHRDMYLERETCWRMDGVVSHITREEIAWNWRWTQCFCKCKIYRTSQGNMLRQNEIMCDRHPRYEMDWLGVSFHPVISSVSFSFLSTGSCWNLPSSLCLCLAFTILFSWLCHTQMCQGFFGKFKCTMKCCSTLSR